MKKYLLIAMALGLFCFVAQAKPAHAAVAFVNATGTVSGATSSSISLTLPWSVTANDVLAVEAYGANASAIPTSGVATCITGNLTLVGATTTPSQGSGMAYGVISSSGSCTVTITYATSTRDGIVVHEISGVNTANPLDAWSEKSIYATAGTAITSGTSTTNFAGDYIFGADDNGSANATSTVGSGFTLRLSVGASGGSMATEDQIQSLAGPISATFTPNTSGRLVTGMMAFESTSVPPTVTSFSASSTSIFLGSSSTLSWTIAGVLSTTTISGNSLSFTTSTASGLVSVTPNATGTFIYTLTASNAYGSYIATTSITVAPPATVSTPPQSLFAAPNAGKVFLSWVAPASNGGINLTQYLVYDRFTGSSTFALYATTTASTTTSTVNGLTNGQSYDFEVIAQNSVGTSSPSSIVSATPSTQTFSFVQQGNCTLTAGSSTCNIVLSQSLSAGNLDIVGCGYSFGGPPNTYISGVSAGGTLVRTIGASSGGSNLFTTAERSVAYILPSTSLGGASPVTITLSTTTSGGACELYELQPNGNPSAVGLDIDGAFHTEASSTLSTALNVALTGGDDAVYQDFAPLAVNSMSTAITGPYNTNAYFLLSGRGYGFAVATPPNGNGPTWTSSSSSLALLNTVAFGWNPSPCLEDTYIDFAGGTDGNVPTPNDLLSSTHGWQGGNWIVVNTNGSITYSTAAAHSLLGSTGRLCGDGVNYPETASLGLAITGSGVEGTLPHIQYDFYSSNLTTASLGSWLYTDMGPSDSGTNSVDSLAVQAGSGFANVESLNGTSARRFILECDAGAASSSYNYASNAWYYLALQYVSGGTDTLNVYNASGTLVNTQTCTSAAYHVSGFILGNPNAGAQVAVGKHIYFSGVTFSLTGDALTPGNSVAPPTISSFSASPSSIALGATTTLTYSASNASGTISITGNNLNLTTSTYSGTQVVTPNATGTLIYTLTANNANGTTTATTSISVIASPAISAVATGTPLTNAATITWTTNPAADSQVYYGTSTTYTASSSYNASYVTSHSVNLTGLSSLTTYYFEVLSSDGVLATSTATFITASAGVPTASNVSATGTVTVGNVLTGTYTFSDPNNQPESGSTYQWVRSSASGGTYSNISGATGTTYTLTNTDIGQYLRFQVTPASLSGTGTMIPSSPTSQIQSGGAPTASSVTITGSSTEGQTLTASYTYFQTNGVASSTPLYQWYEASSSGGTYAAVGGATGNTYALGPADVGQYLKVQITPVAVYPPTNGIAATSSFVGSIAASNLPVASNLSIAGTFTVGNTLTGSYAYSDTGSHAEASSTFQWLEATSSNGIYANITGATATTYTLQTSDVAKYLEFQVTPVSTVATGSSTASIATTQIQNSGVPTASPVTITGTSTEGQVLTGSYTYADPHNFAQASSTFHWLEATSSNGTYASIIGATNLTYTLLPTDVGKYLEFRVIPMASVPPNTGTSTYSVPTVAIAPDSYPTAAPTLISGSLNVGSVLTGSYAYSDTGSHAEASSTFQWIEATTATGTYGPIAGATGKTYIPLSSDLADYLEFQVTPVSSVAVGSSSVSAAMGPITAPLTYYVAPQTGSNLNQGTSSTAPLATLSYLVSNPTVVTPQTGTVASTTAIGFQYTVVITPSASTTIMIPASTTMTTSAGTDFTQLTATTTVNTSTLPANYTPEGSVAFGLASTAVSLSQPITISLPVDPSFNGSTLTVFSSEDGGTTWTSLTTCVVSSAICSFTTSNLSSFTVALYTAPVVTSGGGDGGGGGGGGGGGFYVPIPPVSAASTTTVITAGMTVPQLEALLASLESELQTLEAEAGSSSFTFTRNLQLGMSGVDVHQLQIFLIQEDKGAAAERLAAHRTTDYFGSLTKAALIEFQKTVGITPDSGFFGPITRAWVGEHNL